MCRVMLLLRAVVWRGRFQGLMLRRDMYVPTHEFAFVGWLFFKPHLLVGLSGHISGTWFPIRTTLVHTHFGEAWALGEITIGLSGSRKTFANATDGGVNNVVKRGHCGSFDTLLPSRD